MTTATRRSTLTERVTDLEEQVIQLQDLLLGRDPPGLRSLLAELDRLMEEFRSTLPESVRRPTLTVVQAGSDDAQ